MAVRLVVNSLATLAAQLVVENLREATDSSETRRSGVDIVRELVDEFGELFELFRVSLCLSCSWRFPFLLNIFVLATQNARLVVSLEDTGAITAASVFCPVVAAASTG